MADPRDDDLIRELRALADRLEVPPTPDVRAAVRSRLATERTRPGRSGVGSRLAAWRPVRPGDRRARRWVGVATALAVALLLAVLPPGRAAVADVVGGLLRFAGVQVRPAESGIPPSTRPEPPGSGSAGPGSVGPGSVGPGSVGAGSGAPLPGTRAVPLEEARRLAGFAVGVPHLLGTPEQVRISDPGLDGAPRVVTLHYRGGTVRLDGFAGELDPTWQKTASNGTWTQVGDDTALWFPTGHGLEYVDRGGVVRRETARLAGPTLIWSAGGVSYRLEGPFGMAEAVQIAASVR